MPKPLGLSFALRCVAARPVPSVGRHALRSCAVCRSPCGAWPCSFIEREGRQPCGLSRSRSRSACPDLAAAVRGRSSAPVKVGNRAACRSACGAWPFRLHRARTSAVPRRPGQFAADLAAGRPAVRRIARQRRNRSPCPCRTCHVSPPSAACGASVPLGLSVGRLHRSRLSAVSRRRSLAARSLCRVRACRQYLAADLSPQGNRSPRHLRRFAAARPVPISAKRAAAGAFRPSDSPAMPQPCGLCRPRSPPFGLSLPHCRRPWPVARPRRSACPSVGRRALRPCVACGASAPLGLSASSSANVGSPSPPISPSISRPVGLSPSKVRNRRPVPISPPVGLSRSRRRSACPCRIAAVCGLLRVLAARPVPSVGRRALRFCAACGASCGAWPCRWFHRAQPFAALRRRSRRRWPCP